MQQITNVLGLIAAILTTVAFLPQVLKIYRTKSAQDVSYTMFIMFSSGLVLWLIYGILIRSMPIIVANVATLLLSVVVIALKLRYHK